MLFDLVVEVRWQRSFPGDGQVGTQMLDAGGADDSAGQVRMAEREAEHELQPRHAVQQVVQAGGLPAPLAFALGQPERPLAPVLVPGRAAPGRSAADQRPGTSLSNRPASSPIAGPCGWPRSRSEEHTSELQSRPHLVCRLLLEKKKRKKKTPTSPPQRQQQDHQNN